MICSRSFLVCLSALFVCTVGAGWAQTSVLKQIRAANGDVIGHSERSVVELDDGSRKIITRQEYRFREAGERQKQITSQHTMMTDIDGEVVAIEAVETIGSDRAVISAALDGENVLVTRTIGGDERQKLLPRSGQLVFDNGAAMLKARDAGQAVSLIYDELDLSAPAINQVHLDELTDPASGGQRILLRRRYRAGELLGFERLIFSEEGGLVRRERSTFGTSLSVETLEPGASGEAIRVGSLVGHFLQKSPVRIPRSALGGQIRYKFTFAEDVQFVPKGTGEQRVTIRSNGFVLDICETCGEGLPTDEAYLMSALQPEFWLQSDHPRIQQLVRRIAGREISDLDKMRGLSRLAARQIDELDFVGHFSAVETLARGAGDCTEAAVLLATLGRAAGIPTRVASGLVYSREAYHGVSHTFMPHAWVLAFVDGEWRSFDAALDGFDASHIAFSISDGDPAAIAAGHQIAGLVEWESLAEVRQRDDR